MAALEIPDRVWETQAEVDACLQETGVTSDQVKRWRREGLLPPVKQESLGRGSLVHYPIGTCAQIKAAQELFCEKSRCDYVGLRLWRRSFWVSEDYWRPRLKRFGCLADLLLRFVRLSFRLDDRGEEEEFLNEETLQERAARHPWRGIIVSRIKGRLKSGEELENFCSVLINIGTGEFKIFEFPVEGEKRSADEEATINAFDMGNAERHEILGKKLNLIGVLSPALKSETNGCARCFTRPQP
jgi:hypothetical protein